MNVPGVLVEEPSCMLFPAIVVIVWSVDPLIVYVNIYGVVPLAPVKLIKLLVSFWQTLPPPEIIAFGIGLTVTFPVAVKLTQNGEFFSVIWTV